MAQLPACPVHPGLSKLGSTHQLELHPSPSPPHPPTPLPAEVFILHLLPDTHTLTSLPHVATAAPVHTSGVEMRRGRGYTKLPHTVTLHTHHTSPCTGRSSTACSRNSLSPRDLAAMDTTVSDTTLTHNYLYY